jgi:cell division protease FtsH
VVSEAEKKMTAYHEAGHALVSINQPAADPIHKATIIPRGRALGMVMRLPEADKISYLREKMYADLAISMGGRVAEELIFGHEKVSSGASSDIKYATSLARAMVTEWGMSEKLGPLFYGDDHRDMYTGAGHRGAMSEHIVSQVDAEVKSIVEGAHAKANAILTEHIDSLHLIAKNLLEYETLTGDEIKGLVNGQTIDRSGSDSGSKVSGKTSVPSSRKPVAPSTEKPATA